MDSNHLSLLSSSLHAHARFSTSLNPRISLSNAYISLVPTTSLSIYLRIPFLPLPPSSVPCLSLSPSHPFKFRYPSFLPLFAASGASPLVEIGQVPLFSLFRLLHLAHTHTLSLSHSHSYRCSFSPGVLFLFSFSSCAFAFCFSLLLFRT